MNTTRKLGLLSALVVGATVLASAAPANAAETAVTGDFDCGIATCSYVFSKKATNTIAKDGLAAVGLCGVIPTPGNGACAAGFAVVVVTAKVAKSKGKCVKLNVAKIAPHPIWTSVDGSSRCR
ncbi:hypothetical protein [Amycolatopsis orientalis]|uniref:hypothetical protein n=1 Tax=Amycolatopsis orientalis TaxID=31958 RepID=UPI00040FE6A3|nr:hypothetical protein [Amycolatopsis orientalis]